MLVRGTTTVLPPPPGANCTFASPGGPGRAGLLGCGGVKGWIVPCDCKVELPGGCAKGPLAGGSVGLKIGLGLLITPEAASGLKVVAWPGGAKALGCETCGVSVIF